MSKSKFYRQNLEQDNFEFSPLNQKQNPNKQSLGCGSNNVFSENKVRVDQGVMTEANLTRKIWSMAKSNRES